MSATEKVVPGSPKGWLTACQPGGRTASCLPRRATKILAFCSPNPGKAFTRRRSSAPLAGSLPDPGRLPPVVLHDYPRELLNTLRVGGGEAVEGRPFREDGRQFGGFHRSYLSGIKLAPKTFLEVARGAKGTLERDLLVEHHTDQEGERVLGKQLVSLRVA